MFAVRLAFDIGAPFVVASNGLVFNGRRFAHGEPFDWRAIGVSEVDLFTLWTALKVDCAEATAVAISEPQPVSEGFGAFDTSDVSAASGPYAAANIEPGMPIAPMADPTSTLSAEDVRSASEVTLEPRELAPGEMLEDLLGDAKPGETRTIIVDGERLDVVAGERITFETPAQARKRKRRS